MKIIAIIPARMAASRFPGKPLAPILGLPMIEHVRRRVAMCPLLSEVIVATCDEEIRRVVEAAGGKVAMTSDVHVRCTDRIAEASVGRDADIFINVQGDEPLVMPGMLEALIRPFLTEPDLPSTNLVTPITDEEEFLNPNTVKAVFNRCGDILYLSREPIPSRKKAERNDFPKYKQLGIIAFRSDFLRLFIRLDPTPLEQIESVDMMRAIEHGFKVRMVETRERMISVDVPEDIPRVEAVLETDPLLIRYL